MKKTKYIKLDDAAFVTTKNMKAVIAECAELAQEIICFTGHTDRYANAYFFTNNGNLKERRRKEEKAYYAFAKTFNNIGIAVELSFDVSISRNNFYTYKDIIINGNKTTARVFATILKEIHFVKQLVEQRLQSLNV